MVSERTRNIFEYLCAVLNDGLANLDDVKNFIATLRDIPRDDALFLEGAFVLDPFRAFDTGASSGASGSSQEDTKA